MIKKIATINVVEIRAGFFKGITAFEDTKEGKAEAEKFFIEVINRDFFQGFELDEDDIELILTEKESSNGEGDSYLLVTSN